jgi:hypothetical protein
MGISELLDQIAASNVKDVVWVGPASESDIDTIEQELRCRLPRSFREFLRLVGGGGVPGLEVSGVGARDEFGSVIYDTKAWREEYGLPEHLIIVQRDADDNEPFCLDTSAFSGDECPVLLYYPHRTPPVTEWIAADFASWYANYLAPRLEEE